MLLELNITDFAIIDSLRLSLCPHLNVFTGETGAGKSILVDAISALVGERTGTEVVRSGSERAIIEGIFDVASLSGAGSTAALDGRPREAADETGAELESESLGDLLASLGLEPEDGTLILAREILMSGRSISRVNGRGVPLSTLQRIARFLVDIHGQSAHLALLRPEQHIYYLDRYANTSEMQAEVAALVTQWRAERRELERLRRDEREIERRVELLRYQVEEIEAVKLQPGELDDLETERRRLANAERLGELSVAAHAAIAGDPESDALGAIDLLAQAQRSLADLRRLDDALGEQAGTLEQALFFAQDVAAAIASYQDEIAADPRRQAVVEERLDLIAKLRRKYGATIEEILSYAAEARRELDELMHREQRMSELQERDQALRERIGARAGELSRTRQAAATALAAAMERELDELNMRRARFQVRITQTPSADGVPAELGASEKASRNGKTVKAEALYSFGPTGIDQVEFLIAPNPGEPFKPLAKIASGGETSRLMLALKTILSRADIIPILIFDEIDAGISGRSGQIVGEKLWRLGQSHQVLCVTHLPQIAALGDCHFRVAKTIVGERTTTQVHALSDTERVAELSQILGGTRTAAAEANADELLSRARSWKHTGAGHPVA